MSLPFYCFALCECVRKSTITFTSKVLDSPSVLDVDSEEDLLLLLYVHSETTWKVGVVLFSSERL